MNRILALLVGFAATVAVAAPGVEWLDAGELTTAGYTLGVSHPPGQPGHALLIKAATLLPFGEIAFRANLLSGLATVLAVWGAVSLAGVLVGGTLRRSTNEKSIPL